jgi:hypothetical protein
MSDNVTRGIRSIWMVVLGILATGGATKVWESFNGTHSIDPTVQVVAGLLVVGIVTWAQAQLEDATGRGFLIPEDRKVGDAVLGTGVGSRKFESGQLKAGEDTLRRIGLAHPAHFTSRHGQARY